MSNVLISNTTKQPTPNIDFGAIKNDILGKSYELSISFIGTTRAAELNKKYRKKTYTPNILSFPLSGTVGEIYICPLVAKKQMKDFNLSYKGYVAFLFIHGCLHLKGLDHGATMEKQEQRYKRKYQLR